MACFRALISGKVQGVYFRAFTQKCANNLQLTGWVKNLPDGKVEALACGSHDNIQKFRELLEKGPPLSKVSDVCWEEVPEQTHTDFKILHD